MNIHRGGKKYIEFNREKLCIYKAKSTIASQVSDSLAKAFLEACLNREKRAISFHFSEAYWTTVMNRIMMIILEEHNEA